MLFEDAIGSEAGSPELRLESLRRLEEILTTGSATRRNGSTPWSGWRRWSRSRGEALHLGARRRAGAGARRRRPGAGRLACPAGARSGDSRSAGRRARAAGPVERWSAVIDSAAPADRERAARAPDPRRPDRDGDHGAGAHGRRRTRHRPVARGRHALRRRRRERRRARRSLHGERRVQASSRSCCRATATSIAGITPIASRGWRTRIASNSATRPRRSNGTGAPSTSTRRTRGAGRAAGAARRAGGRAGRGAAAGRGRRQDRLVAAAARPRAPPVGGGIRRRRARPDPRGRGGVRGGPRGRSEAGARLAVRGAAARGRNARLERELLRLAEATGDFAGPARALGETIAAGGAPPLTLAHLHERRGNLLETRLGQSRGGGGELRGGARADARAARAAAQPRARPWSGWVGSPTRPACSSTRTRPHDARHNALLPLYESLALEGGAIRPALAALVKAVDAASGLDPSIRRDLHARAATSFFDHCQDVDAAEGALEAALAADARHVPTLLRRAELQRRRPDRRLLETLLQPRRRAARQPRHPARGRRRGGGAARRRAAGDRSARPSPRSRRQHRSRAAHARRAGSPPPTPPPTPSTNRSGCTSPRGRPNGSARRRR